MEIKKLTQSEKRMAMDLAWEVFIEFEGPDYPQEGTDHFRSFIDNTEMVGELEVYGAFDGKILAGMIALRSSGSHISLFFVRKTYQQRGIGKRLFETAIRSGHAETITVNSSPYAIGIYRRLGFTAVTGEKTENGIRFTPMEYKSELKS